MDDAFNDARVYSPVWSSPGEDACAKPAEPEEPGADVDSATLQCFVDALDERSVRAVLKSLLDPAKTDAPTARVAGARVAAALQTMCRDSEQEQKQRAAEAETRRLEAEAKAQAQREHAARISALATPKPHARPGTAEPPRTAVRDRASSGKKQIRLFTATPASPAAPRTPGYQQPRSQETRRTRRVRGTASQNFASTSISAAFRGFVARRDVARTRAAMTMQREWRRWRARRQLAKLRTAAARQRREAELAMAVREAEADRLMCVRQQERALARRTQEAKEKLLTQAANFSSHRASGGGRWLEVPAAAGSV